MTKPLTHGVLALMLYAALLLERSVLPWLSDAAAGVRLDLCLAVLVVAALAARDGTDVQQERGGVRGHQVVWWAVGLGVLRDLVAGAPAVGFDAVTLPVAAASTLLLRRLVVDRGWLGTGLVLLLAGVAAALVHAGLIAGRSLWIGGPSVRALPGLWHQTWGAGLTAVVATPPAVWWLERRPSRRR